MFMLYFQHNNTYLSKETATRLYTEAATDTP